MKVVIFQYFQWPRSSKFSAGILSAHHLRINECALGVYCGLPAHSLKTSCRFFRAHGEFRCSFDQAPPFGKDHSSIFHCDGGRRGSGIRGGTISVKANDRRQSLATCNFGERSPILLSVASGFYPTGCLPSCLSPALHTASWRSSCSVDVDGRGKWKVGSVDQSLGIH